MMSWFRPAVRWAVAEAMAARGRMAMVERKKVTGDCDMDGDDYQ